MSPKTFMQSVPAEWMDAYRKAFGDPVLAGVSYKWEDWYGYVGYQIGSHVPAEMPRFQGVTSGNLSVGRKTARLRLTECARLWGCQLQAGDYGFSYVGPCDQSWWEEYYTVGDGNRYQRFVGVTYEPVAEYGYALWGSPYPLAGWNVIRSDFGDTVYEVSQGSLQAYVYIDQDAADIELRSLVLSPGAARFHFVSAMWNSSNVVAGSVYLVLESAAPSWSPATVTWNNAPSSWVEVDKWQLAQPPVGRTIDIDPETSFRVRIAKSDLVLVNPLVDAWVNVQSVVAYAHA